MDGHEPAERAKIPLSRGYNCYITNDWTHEKKYANLDIGKLTCCSQNSLSVTIAITTFAAHSFTTFLRRRIPFATFVSFASRVGTENVIGVSFHVLRSDGETVCKQLVSVFVSSAWTTGATLCFEASSAHFKLCTRGTKTVGGNHCGYHFL
jgi:hypothetical protein